MIRIKPKKKKRLPMDKVAIQLKAKGIKAVEPVTIRRKGEWEKVREAKPLPREKKKTPSPLVVLKGEEMEQMLHKKAGGMTFEQIAQEHGVTTNWVKQAMTAKYVNNAQGRQVLNGVLLENAIASGAQARVKMHELNGMQSVVAAGIMTQRYIDLDKHIANMPKDSSDFAAIAKLSDTMDQLAADLGLADVHGPSILDVDAEVTRDSE